MKRRMWIVISCLLVFNCCFAIALRSPLQEKAESIIPIPRNTPPEGNTTFLDGTTWCVAKPGAPQLDLQRALDWACGLGATDCSPVLPGGSCHQPDTLLSHASYVFNSYYQQNGDSDVACYFGGTAVVTNRNPSYGSCAFLSSSETSDVPSQFDWRDFVSNALMILLLMHYTAYN